MRPEKAHRIIRATLERFRKDEPTAMYQPDMLRAVHKLQAKQSIWHIEHGYALSSYVPNPNEDYESITNEIEYISDRFNAEHRLAWLEVGIQEGLF